MAKKLVKNYVFSPGQGLDDNLRPNAYSLISQNKIFLQKEINGFLTTQIADAVKCQRDLDYILDASGFDVALGTNYNSVFIGLAEFNSNEVTGTVLRTIARARDRVLALSQVSASPTATTRSTNYFNEVIDIAQNGRAAANSVTFTNPTSATASQIAAKTRLVNNKNFIAAEVNAWVNATYPAHNHNVDKCTRDVKYTVDALCYDILYGGNSATHNNAKFFFYSFADNSPGIDPTHKDQTVAAYERLRTIVGQIVLGQDVTKSGTYAEVQDKTGTSASAGDAVILQNLTQLIADVINSGSKVNADAILAANTKVNPAISWADAELQTAKSAIDSNKTAIITAVNSFAGYTFDSAKCERDSGYVIDALLFDLRYGGNERIRRVSTFYWNEDVPQVDGDRVPELEAYYFLTDLINNYIITNTVDLTPKQSTALQVIDNSKVSETGTNSRVTSLLSSLIGVIQNGLTSLPELESGLGRVELLGKIGLEDLLIISNVTTNEVIYNFAEPTKGGTVNFITGNSDAYPQAESVSTGTTIINFKANTSSMASTDNIQIFLEQSELKIRPYDFGTDAIERMRVAMPQAMIDADFEYGLQPTKWQALSLQRGYPATYELSATDMTVVNITTDASTGTGGVGASLITVTTNNAHGFKPGTPFTIRALATSVTGFNRAEGTFIVSTVPTDTTFTYYAKSKVGTNNGDILATSNTQLREANFYTGASVGSPTFTVASNGASGTFTSSLAVPSGSTSIAFTGTAPITGVPVTGTGIASGTQVSAVFGSGGTVGSYYVKNNVSAGASTIELTSITGILGGMAINNGSGSQLLVTSVGESSIVLNGQTTVPYVGDQQSYTNVVLSSTNYITGEGNGATFDVTVTDGIYSVVLGANPGTGYIPGDTLKILGSNLGGATPGNDVTINVLTVDPGTGAIQTFEVISGVGTGTGSYDEVTSLQRANVLANNGIVTVTRNAGSYSVLITDGGTGFNRYNRFKIDGSVFGGVPVTNDVIITATEVTAGVITGATISGVAARGDQISILSTVVLSTVTNAPIPVSTTLNYSAIATIDVSFPSNHGFVPGTTVLITISSTGTNHQLAAGPFYVSNITSLSSFRYIARAPGTIATGTLLSGTVYIRPDAYFSHRPFDGGVMLGTGGPQHGAQAVRQSKKYIRYQSGKGAMYNTGALFAPSFDVQSIVAAGTTVGSFITVTTDDVDHGVQAGATVRITGVKTVGFDGEYVVSEVLDERTYRIVAKTQLGGTVAEIGSQCQMALLKWHGSVVRSGPFDDQNGMFWQYDGQTLAVGRRTSTFQVAGSIAINVDSNQVIGTNTRFKDQLQEGDRIVIRGMTHVVTNIASQTAMTVTPDFRGVRNVTGVKISKVQDIIIPQSEWNLDRCDGTGASGYNIDVTKMQMVGMQFTWYGAGFIDWMLRGPDGNYVFCHRLKGNNLNTEAYMRTGNLPVRYEVLNEGARSRLAGGVTSSQTTLTLDNASSFPESGTVYVENEIISYSGKNKNTLLNCTRGTTLSNFAGGALRSYAAGSAAAHADNTGVILVSNTTSPIISHWGSAYLIDGLFDEDRGYIFSYAATNVSISTTKTTAFLIRLAPSVSNAVTGDLGERELLNRAQLLLKQISITADTQTTGAGGLVIEGVLNPQNYPVNPANIGWAGLSGLSAGGQPSFAQIAPGGSVNWASGSTETFQTATTTAKMTETVTNAFDKSSGTSYLEINASSWEASNLHIPGNNLSLTSGITIDDPKYPAGTTISAVYGPYTGSGRTYYQLYLTRNSNTSFNRDSTISFSLGGASSSNTSTLYFTSTSWTTSGATTGTEVSDNKFPPNTRVSTVSAELTFGAITYRRVTFTQTSVSSTAEGGTVQFKFGQPPYALPGETVFSFIANPGETATLDLSELKELTTTAIGGRGAFPNGPDVLAINVYKVAGTAVNANLLLRWGEAQA